MLPTVWRRHLPPACKWWWCLTTTWTRASLWRPQCGYGVWRTSNHSSSGFLRLTEWRLRWETAECSMPTIRVFFVFSWTITLWNVLLALEMYSFNDFTVAYLRQRLSTLFYWVHWTLHYCNKRKQAVTIVTAGQTGHCYTTWIPEWHLSCIRLTLQAEIKNFPLTDRRCFVLIVMFGVVILAKCVKFK